MGNAKYKIQNFGAQKRRIIMRSEVARGQVPVEERFALIVN